MAQDITCTFTAVLGLLQSGKRKKFEEEFTKVRKVQLKGGEKAKIELCRLIQLILVHDGRFSALLISDLYNLITDKNKNVALAALDTVSLCIDVLLYNAVECHSHADFVPDKLYFPGGIDVFKNALADYQCLRSAYQPMLKGAKSSEHIFLIYKILAAELQAFAEIDVSDYISYENKKYFSIKPNSHELCKKVKKPNYPNCGCPCNFLSKKASTMSFGELKPLRFSKCTNQSAELKIFFERWRNENMQLLCSFLKRDAKSDLNHIKFLMSAHVASLLISCYPLTYQDLLFDLGNCLKPIAYNHNQLINTLNSFDSKDQITKFIFKQLIRIVSSSSAMSLHEEISERLIQCGFNARLDTIYREIKCLGSVIMECPAPFSLDNNKVYKMTCNFEDFGGLCTVPSDSKIGGKLLEMRGPIYYKVNPERVELIGHLSAGKPLSKLIDIALSCDVTKDKDGQPRSDILQYEDVPACKVLYFTPEMLKFSTDNQNLALCDVDNSQVAQFNQIKEGLLAESNSAICVKVATTNDIMNNFQFYSKLVANQILNADYSLSHPGAYIENVKQKLMNKILLDNYLDPQVTREMLTLYINQLIAKLDLERYIKSNPDMSTVQNAVDEWSNYFNCVIDLLYHKSVLDYISSTSIKFVKDEHSGNALEEFLKCLHISNKQGEMSYDELLQLSFDGFYSEKLLTNRAYRDAYIKSICSFVLSLPCLTGGLIDRFYNLLDSLGGSLLIFSLVSNLLKRSRAADAKKRIFSLFFKALYHKTPSVRNLFCKLIESPKGLYITFDGKTCRYSSRECEELHDYLCILVNSRFGEKCSKCSSGGKKIDISDIESVMELPIWQWPIELIIIISNWSKSLGYFQLSATMEVINCSKCKRKVFDITSDKILYNVLHKWDNLEKSSDFGWQNPQYIHKIWLEETIFYIFLNCLKRYSMFASNIDTCNSMSIDNESSSGFEAPFNTDSHATLENQATKEDYSDDNNDKMEFLHEKFLVPIPFLKRICDEIIDNLGPDAIGVSVYAVSAICSRSPRLLTTLIDMLDFFCSHKATSAEKKVICDQSALYVCKIVNKTVIDILSNLCATNITYFSNFLARYLSASPNTCLIRHILSSIAAKWAVPSYNIVDKLAIDSAETRIILLCINAFKNWNCTAVVVPLIAFLPKNIATNLLTFLFMVEGDEISLKNCIENVLSVPNEIRNAMDQKVTSAENQWLMPEELLITVYRFSGDNLDRKKQAEVLDYIISFVETNQRRPHNIPKHLTMSLHSVVKSCAMIVEDKEPISFIFGRLLCQVVQNVPSVRGGMVQHVIPALINRKTWSDKQLWRGVVISFGILWPEFKEPLTLLIFQLPQGIGEDLLQSMQQRHSVIPDIASIVSKKQYIRSLCPKYISSILGV